jgi:hypothetical protein
MNEHALVERIQVRHEKLTAMHHHRPQVRRQHEELTDRRTRQDRVRNALDEDDATETLGAFANDRIVLSQTHGVESRAGTEDGLVEQPSGSWAKRLALVRHEVRNHPWRARAQLFRLKRDESAVRERTRISYS